MSHRTIQICLINYVVAPLIGVNIVARLGVSGRAFFISGITWLLVVWLTKFVSALMAHETPEETEEIDKEVQRMEGRRIKISNTFDVVAPEGFRFRPLDGDSIEVVNVETKAKARASIDLTDSERIEANILKAIDQIKA